MRRKASKRIVVVGKLYDTQLMSVADIKDSVQARLDDWLGKDNVRFEFNKIDDRTFEYTFYRKYGPWYEPSPFYTPGDHGYIGNILMKDRQIFLGEGWQSGTYADLTEHTCWYVGYNPQDFVLSDYQKLCQQLKADRPKTLDYKDNLEKIVITIGY